MFFHIVVNPVAGNHAGERKGNQVRDYLEERGKACLLHFSSKEEGITEICRKLTCSLKEETSLIIVGGDGTMNEAINGMEHFELLKVGFIPCGTGCDMLRDMDIAVDFESLMASILLGQVRHTSVLGEVEYVDLGKKRRFQVSCGMGFDAEICHAVSVSKLKKPLNYLHIGSLIYLLEAFRLIVKNRNFPMHITLDAEETVRYADCKFASIHNHACEGGGYRFCPDADYQSDTFSMCVTYHITLLTVLFLFLKARKGTHTRYRQFTAQYVARKLELETEQPVWVHTDGETPYESAHIVVRVMEEKIRLLI